jgi:hypothetical protein
MLQSASEKLTGLVERRAEVQRMKAEFACSERHARGLISIPRLSCPYESQRDDRALRQQVGGVGTRETPVRLPAALQFCVTDGPAHQPQTVQRVSRAAGLCLRLTRT